jgi:hypothetical protein
VVDELAAVELQRRQVDRQPDVRRPSGGLRAGLVQHPASEHVDQADLLGQRDEVVGRDHATARMAPAQQRFERHDALIGQHDQGLVVQLECTGLDRLPQVGFEFAPTACTPIEFGAEVAVRSTAERLGLVERQVGALQQIVRVRAVDAAERDADAGADRDRLARHVERLCDRLHQTAGERLGRGGLLAAVLDDRELVAAQAGHHVAVAHTIGQALCHQAQQCVAGRVAVGVVHRLETVEVQAHHRVWDGGRRASRR